MRPGWRLLIFLAIAAALFAVEGLIARVVMRGTSQHFSFTPGSLMVAEGASFAAIWIASFIMAAMEKRTLGDYGLPWQKALRGEFWWGTVSGFASISVLIGSFSVSRVFHFDGLALHGIDIWRYGFLWSAVFLLVGLFEEFGFRGYTLSALADGIGFWPAALLMSALFGYVHHNNSGETWLGAFSAGEIGLVFCLMLRRSGCLWLPIGFHAAWDWGETFFYGVPDSGQVAAGHLLNTSMSGPVWLTGGSVGPEASWLCILLVAIIALITHMALPEAKYPLPRSAVPSPDPGTTAPTLNVETT